jgi:hypothetical protein
LAIVPSPSKVCIAPSTGVEERARVLMSARNARLRNDHEYWLTIVFHPLSYGRSSVTRRAPQSGQVRLSMPIKKAPDELPEEAPSGVSRGATRGA